MLDFLITPFYIFGIAIWNLMLALIGATSAQTPMSFSGGTWYYISNTLYPGFFGIGATLMNTFFLIGYFRQVSNLKENFTLEIFIESCIKVVVANAMMVSGLLIMDQVFGIAGDLTGIILNETPITFSQADFDAGAKLFYMLFGIIFFVVCLVCSATVFLVVYGRYLDLYLLVLAMPVAMSTLPGGHGISQTAFSWVKTFLSKTFSIVVIAIALVIASRLCNSISFGSLSGIGGILDGAIQALQNMFTMILLAASVKGADTFMRRTFGL